MSLGGGGIDTSGLENIENQKLQLAQQQMMLGEQMTGTYAEPALNAIYETIFGAQPTTRFVFDKSTPMAGFTPSTPATATSPATPGTAGTWTSPVSSRLFGAAEANQQAQLGGQLRQLQDTNLPMMTKAKLGEQARTTSGASFSKNVLDTVNGLIANLTGQTGAAQQGMQQAGQSIASAGDTASMIAQLEQQNQASKNESLMGLFSTIGNFAGQIPWDKAISGIATAIA